MMKAARSRDYTMIAPNPDIGREAGLGWRTASLSGRGVVQIEHWKQSKESNQQGELEISKLCDCARLAALTLQMTGRLAGHAGSGCGSRDETKLEGGGALKISTPGRLARAFIGVFHWFQGGLLQYHFPGQL